MIEMLMYEGEKVIYQALGLCMYLVLNVGCLMFPVVFLAAKCLFCDYCYGGSECYRKRSGTNAHLAARLSYSPYTGQS